MTLYVAPYLREWKDVGLQAFNIPGTERLASIRAPEGQPGVLLVFSSMEALLEVYPDADPSKVLVITSGAP